MTQLDRVDPALLPQLDGPSRPPISQETLPQVREISRQRSANAPAYGQTTPRRETISGDLDLYIFEPTPRTTPAPCLLWLHGGGYIMGQAADMWHGPLFAEQTGCVVVSVDYRLAPEHPFPAALIDAFAALNWLANNAAPLGIDPTRIAIGGASAGAGLAAGLALYTRDQGGPIPSFQLLLYPMLDNLHDTPSGRLADHPVWPRSDSLAAWELYLGGVPGRAASPYAAAARATDLAGLPPARIVVGEVDLFLDENASYAKRLTQAGVPVEFQTYPGMFHSGEVAGANTAIGKRMINDTVAALRVAMA